LVTDDAVGDGDAPAAGAVGTVVVACEPAPSSEDDEDDEDDEELHPAVRATVTARAATALALTDGRGSR
jgi:hypothetical protein